MDTAGQAPPRRLGEPVIYLETSAVNLLADILDLRKPVRNSERRFFISPVTVWEILLTQSEERKEYLISFLQRSCSARMLPSPSELAIAYMRMGCPREEPRRRLRSRLALGTVWREICEDPDRTFIFDGDELKRRSQFVRGHFGDVARAARRAAIGADTADAQSELLSMLDGLIGCRQESRRTQCRYGERREIWRLAAYIMSLVLCAQVDFDPTPIISSWQRLRIDGVEGRIRFLLTHHPLLFRRGPFAEMAIVAYRQLRDGTHTRGILWDCMHAPYIVYSDLFVTNDAHFLNLGPGMPRPLTEKVCLVRDLLKRATMSE
jgi:hypothetical protein